MRAYKPALALSAALAAAGCGAKTGLLVPDAAPDAPPPIDVADTGVDAPPDAYVCVPGQFALTARSANTLFVMDRSGSMAFGLAGDTPARPGTSSRWTLLEQALRATLPLFPDRIDVGALLFPEAGAPMASSCALPNVPDVDVDPAPNNAASVLAFVDATGPGGSTPTYAALYRAYTWFVRHPDRARADYLVLTTDGAPNCNGALDPTSCTCTEGTGPVGGRGCAGRVGANGCLDETRTVELIHEIATNPATAVPTYVIGIAPDADPVFADALSAMAVAGGRPKVLPNGTQTFYSVRQPGDLAAALTEIQNSIARCSYVTPSRPDDPDGLSLTIDGEPVPRDTTRANGWDWTDEAYGEVTLFGSACAQASMGAPTLRATVGCRDAGR